MTKNTLDSRREPIRKSLGNGGSEVMTLHAVKRMVNAPGFQSENFTIIGYYRTFLFEFPRTKPSETIEPYVIHEDSNIKAAIVSDLMSYFERPGSHSPHYSIDASLRAGVKHIYHKSLEQTASRTTPNFPIFIIIQANREFASTVLDRGECYSRNEDQDGKEMIKGGRQGKKAFFAVKTIDGSWPEINPDMSAVNAVLAAVKIEQDETSPIRELYHHSCFVEEQGRAVYLQIPTVRAHASVVAEVEAVEIRDKAEKIEAMLHQIMSGKVDSDIQKLFDSLILEDTKDDDYLRLSYLRIWQAVDDTKKAHLGCPQIWNTRTAIAGKKTPKELNDYRNRIAHLRTGRIDPRYLHDLQITAMELLRSKYRSN